MSKSSTTSGRSLAASYATILSETIGDFLKSDLVTPPLLRSLLHGYLPRGYLIVKVSIVSSLFIILTSETFHEKLLLDLISIGQTLLIINHRSSRFGIYMP